jgi:hypothetical protein
MSEYQEEIRNQFQQLINLLLEFIQRIDNIHSLLNNNKRNEHIVKFFKENSSFQIDEGFAHILNIINDELDRIGEFIAKKSKKIKEDYGIKKYGFRHSKSKNYEEIQKQYRTQVFEKKKMDIKYNNYIGNDSTDLGYEGKANTVVKKSVKKTLPYSCIPRVEDPFPDMSFDNIKK